MFTKSLKVDGADRSFWTALVFHIPHHIAPFSSDIFHAVISDLPDLTEVFIRTEEHEHGHNYSHRRSRKSISLC